MFFFFFVIANALFLFQVASNRKKRELKNNNNIHINSVTGICILLIFKSIKQLDLKRRKALHDENNDCHFSNLKKKRKKKLYLHFF